MEEGTVTTMIDPSRTLGELVLVSPSLAAEFDQLGLDYCCGGNHSLAQVCERAGLDVSDVVARLSIVPPRAPAPWASLGPAELVDHIEATHHAYLWQELPRLTELADKVARVHGHRHPELADVVAVVGQLRADLEPHLLEEERRPVPEDPPAGGGRRDAHLRVRRPTEPDLGHVDGTRPRRNAAHSHP